MSQTPAPAPGGGPDPAPSAPAPRSGRPLLFIAAALLLGWLAWLSYAALTKSREPIVSRAQVAAAGVAVVAEVTTAEADGELDFRRPEKFVGQSLTKIKQRAGKPAIAVKVVETLWPTKEKIAGEIAVRNLPEAVGYSSPGQYLLLLKSDPDAEVDAPGGSRPAYFLVGPQDSPGARLEAAGPPVIYRWGPDVRAQAARLLQAKE